MFSKKLFFPPLNSATLEQYNAFPISTYMSVRDISPIIFIKLGKLCIVSGEVVANKTWDGMGVNTGIILPVPHKKFFGVGSEYKNEGRTTKIVIQTDGELIFQNGFSGSIYGFSIAYIAK